MVQQGEAHRYADLSSRPGGGVTGSLGYNPLTSEPGQAARPQSFGNIDPTLGEPEFRKVLVMQWMIIRFRRRVVSPPFPLVPPHSFPLPTPTGPHSPIFTTPSSIIDLNCASTLRLYHPGHRLTQSQTTYLHSPHDYHPRLDGRSRDRPYQERLCREQMGPHDQCNTSTIARR